MIKVKNQTKPSSINYMYVSNGTRLENKQIYLNSKWFTEEYYTIINREGCLIIKKCYMEIPRRAYKFNHKNKSFRAIYVDIPNGKYEVDMDKSTEDELVIYY